MKIDLKDLKVLVIEEESIDFYLDFISMIKKKMDHPEYLGDFTRDDLISILRNKGVILMYKYGNILGASSMMIPATKKDMEEMGLSLDYTKVMDYGPCAVFEDYRGNGIQKYMNERCDRLCRELGYQYAVTTVHPDNTYSIHNIESCGFQYVGEKEFSRGRRKIYQKEL